VDAELVLDRHAAHVVRLGRLPVRPEPELRHEEQRDALGAGRRIRQAGEHEVTILSVRSCSPKVMKIFWPLIRKVPSPRGHRLGAQRADVEPPAAR
jgi:hypothetical protein